MDALELAYRYPFSQHAKSVIEGMQTDAIDPRYLERAADHLKQSVNGSFEYVETSIGTVKRDYLLTYLYSRMLASAIGDMQLINAFTYAESKRAAEAMYLAGNDELLEVAQQLDLTLAADSGREMLFDIKLTSFLPVASKSKTLMLVNQRLNKGLVYLDRNEAIALIRIAARRSIAKGLPINSKQLPKDVLDYARHVRIQTKSAAQIAPMNASGSDWIAHLLNTPIADVRHRTVNLVLAPYLVNVRMLPVEDATKVINEYIERCKQINPDTDVNERYVSYQCTYAKRRGMKPLSFSKAQELFRGVIDLSAFQNKGEADKK